MTAVATDKKPEKVVESAASPMASSSTEFIHQFMVISVDKNTGKINWKTVVKEELPAERTHELGSWASNSPVTDGEDIFACFGSRGLFCLDMKGMLNGNVISVKWILWPALAKEFTCSWQRQDLYSMGSPGEILYLCTEQKDRRRCLEERPRRNHLWATPLVVEINGKTQVITSATKKVRSYDSETGEIVWECSGLTRNVIPCPVYADGIVYLMSGFMGNALKAIDLAKAKGDVTGSTAILWEYNQDTPYTPSPLLMDGKLYFLKANNGMLTCLDAKDGKAIYSNQKLNGINNIYSSPTGNKDKIYVAATGVVDVVKAGSNFELISQNALDDTFEASPIITGNDLILRGYKYLYSFSVK